MTKPEISPRQRSQLRAQAHAVHPTVLVGEKGLTEAVLKETSTSLNAHELVKLRVAGASREEREAMLAQLCAALDCAPIQHLGRTLVVYRPRSDQPAG